MNKKRAIWTGVLLVVVPFILNLAYTVFLFQRIFWESNATGKVDESQASEMVGKILISSGYMLLISIIGVIVLIVGLCMRKPAINQSMHGSEPQ
jgi:uncharacterized membrane protein